jgi:hypothetical protein
MTWFPDPGPSPTDLANAGSRAASPRPWILFGMGEEGGEPIYAQARSFRLGRLPQVLFNRVHLSSSLSTPYEKEYTRLG